MAPDIKDANAVERPNRQLRLLRCPLGMMNGFNEPDVNTKIE